MSNAKKSPMAAAIAVKVPSASLRTVPLKSIDTRGVKLPARSDPKVVALVESIGEVGLLAPVLVDEHLRLISGRHRFVAHQVLGLAEIDVKVSDLDELGLKLARIDENLVRQTLTALERAEALEERQRVYEAMHPQAKHGGAPGKKGGGKSKAATVAGFAKDTAEKTGTSERSVQRYVEAAKKLAPDVKAKIAGTPVAESITELEKLAKLAPEMQQQVAALVSMNPEKTTVKGAVKGLRKEAALKNVLEYTPPVGSYSVIVTDVSWEYDDQLDGSDAARGGVEYATQKMDEILAMKIPAAPDCALWFWVTNAFLIDGSAARVLEAWGFKPVALLTWRKVDKDGAPRLGSGHWLRNNTEHAVLAIKGKPFVDGSNQLSCFDAPRGQHSEKPEEFFRIAEKVTPCGEGARLELNAIKERKGWVTSGSEQQAAAREKRGPIDPGPVEDAELEQPATTPIRWYRIDNHHSVAAAGEGKTGKYKVTFKRKPLSSKVEFVWSLTEQGWPDSPAFDTLEAAQQDAEAIEEQRLRGAPLAVTLGAGADERPSPPGAKKRKLQIKDVPAEDASDAASAPLFSIEWAEKKHPLIVDVGRGGGFRFNIERTRNQKLKKAGGFIWRRWPERGRTGRATSLPEVYETASDARAAAAFAAAAVAKGAA